MNDKTINNDERADNDLIEDQYDGPSKSQRKR
ncbi:MAG: hypothetical protein ACI8VR_001885, partial [Candidatus Azotimanducaceae bacterium]